MKFSEIEYDEKKLKALLGNINILSGVAVYAQIENAVRFAISSGKLKAEDKLPSVRELSEWLKTNPNTVAKAYRDLEVTGIVFTRRGMGVFVEKGIGTKCQEYCRTKILGRLFEVLCEATAAGVSSKEAKEYTHKCLQSAVAPYCETPTEILNLAKKKVVKKV